MVYRRFTRRWRRRIRPRRSSIRRIGKRGRMRRMRPVKGMKRILSFSRWGTNTTMEVKDISGGLQAGGWTFQIDQSATFTDFSNLFDEYKLNAVVVKFHYHQDAGTTDNADTSYGTTPIMHMAIDYNDASTPGSIGALQQYASYRQVHMNRAKSWSIKLYPKAQAASYRSLTTTAYGPKKGWINMVYPDVPHYALKWWIDAGNNGSGQGDHTVGFLTTNVKYYFQVKSIN